MNSGFFCSVQLYCILQLPIQFPKKKKNADRKLLDWMQDHST